MKKALTAMFLAIAIFSIIILISFPSNTIGTFNHSVDGLFWVALIMSDRGKTHDSWIRVSEVLTFVNGYVHPKYARGNYFKKTTKEAVEKLTESYLKYLDWNVSNEKIKFRHRIGGGILMY
ncbi:hypothetical protein ACWGXJ_26420 [Paenibacillus sp. S33]